MYNVCQPTLSNFSESHLYQRKLASNVKLVSVNVSSVYASSVSELVKPLKVSEPVYSSNATKHNVCNASSVSQFIKPLNVSKRVFSSNKTKRYVCNASSVSQLIKASNVSKPVCFSNATERNVCKVSSVSQLVKPSTVSKPIHSSKVLNLMFVTFVMFVTSAVLANSSKHLMLLNLSVPVMQVILSFVIPLVSLFLILLVIVSQINLLVNLLM